MKNDAEATQIAQARRTTIENLSSSLRKELEWIPLKALRKERTERYSSAEAMGQDVGTPAARSGLSKDVYLTLEPGAAPGDPVATIRVFVKPMIMWLWIGGLVMAIGTVLSAFPGRRRRAVDPVSAPIEVEETAPVESGTPA